MLRSFDFKPDLLIPRMEWTFNSEERSFQYAIPTADIQSARSLKEDELPISVREPLQKNFQDCLVAGAIENTAGFIALAQTPDFVTVNFQVNPLPRFIEVKAVEEPSYLKRMQAANALRRPQLVELRQLMRKLSEISLLQSQFGIPAEQFNKDICLPAARIVFTPDAGRFTPHVVVTDAFHTAHTRAYEADKGESLAKDTMSYIRHFDPEAHDAPMATSLQTYPDSIVHIAAGCTCFGCRESWVDQAEQKEPSVMRLQTGDRYEAAGHNLGPDYFLEAIMVVVGSINRIAREREFTTIPV